MALQVLMRAIGEQHVAAMLLLLLPAKLFTINIVTDVAPFPDLSCIKA
jgi:hypothetical protein